MIYPAGHFLVWFWGNET